MALTKQQIRRGFWCWDPDHDWPPDSTTEIERLSRLAAETGRVPDVMVRVTVGVEAHTHEFIATAHEDQKFGLALAGPGPARPTTRARARATPLRVELWIIGPPGRTV